MQADRDDLPMSGGNRNRGKHGGHLSAEDSALWRYVTRDVRPAAGKHRVGVVPAELYSPDRPAPPLHAHRPPSPPSQQQNTQVAAATPLPRKGTRSSEPVAATPSGAVRHTQRPAEQTSPVVLERRKARRIARGAIEIEARLDLHGLTQDEAHHALSAFIRRCATGGLKTVLVITGKGAPVADHAASGYLPFGQRERGVLRRNVPRWLAAPELRALVVSCSTAHVRHGGEGALYVMLRR